MNPHSNGNIEKDYDTYAGFNNQLSDSEIDLFGEAVEVTKRLDTYLTQLDKCEISEIQLERNTEFFDLLYRAYEIEISVTGSNEGMELSDVLFDLSRGYELDEKLWERRK